MEEIYELITDELDEKEEKSYQESIAYIEYIKDKDFK